VPVPTVRLKIRVKLPNGSRAYIEPVFSSNNKLKPHYGLVDGKPRHHPEGVYHLRYMKNGKRVWEPVGKDPQAALTAQRRVEHKLEGIDLDSDGSEPVVVVQQNGKTDLAEAMAEYLKDIASAKSKSTLYAYRHTLKVFATTCSKKYLEQVTRRDILNYHRHLKESGNGTGTESNGGCELPLLRVIFSGYDCGRRTSPNLEPKTNRCSDLRGDHRWD
jgi:integrase/recombinase XerD